MPTKIVYKLYNLLGVAATLTAVTCWACGTIEETAYVGTVEIHYPDTGQKLDGRGQSQQCIWTISAYKKDLVVYLEFIDVNLSANLLNDTCLNNIKVYDGSEISDNRLAIICGNDEPTLVTSSRYSMVVFTSNASSGYDGSFRLRYKAVKERLSQTASDLPKQPTDPHTLDTSSIMEADQPTSHPAMTRYSSEICNRVFTRKDALTRHHDSAHGRQRHPCTTCGKCCGWDSSESTGMSDQTETGLDIGPDEVRLYPVQMINTFHETNQGDMNLGYERVFVQRPIGGTFIEPLDETPPQPNPTSDRDSDIRFHDEEERLQTFSGCWSDFYPVDPISLAKNGFIFIGPGDLVKYSSQTLRIAFGGFIGAIACVVICSGGIRRYMKSRPSRSLHFFLGGHRINIGPTEGAGARNSRRAANTQDTPSVGKRVTQFFQRVVARIRGVNSPSELARWTSDAAPGAARDASTAHAHSADPQDLDEHDSFGYQAIPVASFTSDPAAVKPPTYEESISNLNPLYLNPLTGQAFYNNGFQIKDEDRGFVPGFSPPPPYSESYTSHDVTSEGGVMHICTGPNFRTCQINTHTVETLTPVSLTPSTEALTNRVPGSTEVTQKTTEVSGHDVEPSACALFPDPLHTSSARAKNVRPLDMDNTHTTHRSTASAAKPPGTDSTTVASTCMVDITSVPTTSAPTTTTHTNTTPPTIAPTSHTEPASASSSEPDLPHPTDTHTALVSDITHNTSPHTREQETDEPQNFETLTIDCFHSDNDHDA
ncbi:uncharacterized protein LOC131949708 [Physella acuta]|uniref:uncharacterized protein LOC131949708 n=1 Tax=Physella acuta TaxID=109671 RepID=UPI0027DC5289|nr:uncharacterized protein LOC131949708 [Physella acuta]